jgi:hypothetical protein
MASLDDCWKDLTDSEKNTCDEFNGHRAISDWPEYSTEQEDRKHAAKEWLSDRLDELRDLIKTESSDENHEQNRYNRRDYLKAVVEDGYKTIRRVGPHYPADKATDSEAVYIEEREYYCAWDSAYESQKARKLDNLHWLEDRRKYVWNCAEGNVDDVAPGWDKNNRRVRYDNLQIATHYGSAWDEWQEDQEDDAQASSGNWRDKSSKWHESHLGITESPANSIATADRTASAPRKTAALTAHGYAISRGAVAGHGAVSMRQARSRKAIRGSRRSRRSRTTRKRAKDRSRVGRRTGARQRKAISSFSLVADSMSEPSARLTATMPIHGRAIRPPVRAAAKATEAAAISARVRAMARHTATR